MQVACEHDCSDSHISKKLQNAEGMFDSYLTVLEIKFEIDKHVMREMVP